MKIHARKTSHGNSDIMQILQWWHWRFTKYWTLCQCQWIEDFLHLYFKNVAGRPHIQYKAEIIYKMQFEWNLDVNQIKLKYLQKIVLNNEVFEEMTEVLICKQWEVICVAFFLLSQREALQRDVLPQQRVSVWRFDFDISGIFPQRTW